MNRNRTQKRLTMALAALVAGSVMINPTACVPKDFGYDVAAATQRTLSITFTALVVSAVNNAVFGNFISDDNSNDNSAGG